MTVEEFTKLVATHDFYYQMSDDMRIWKKGTESQTKIDVAMKGRPELVAIYMAYKNKENEQV